MTDQNRTDTLLQAILTLMVDEREARPPERRGTRTEILLANAGLGATDIAALTGRQPAAVRMTLSRARRSKGGEKDHA